MSTKPALHLLSHRVRILSVEKKDLPLVTHSLLDITLKLLANGSPHRRLVIPAGSVCIYPASVYIVIASTVTLRLTLNVHFC